MRQTMLSKYSFTAVVMTLAILFAASRAFGQTSSFTYQGRLTDGGTAPNGNYDLQFALWDSLSGGGQVGSTQTLNAVAVSNGVFTVSLDFGANAFNGASRFLEISARPSGGGSFTLLSPRQQITSTPYAVRSLNAATADNVPAATVINAVTQYNLGGSRILSNAGINNTFVGTDAGTTNTSGTNNIFVGKSAGAANTIGGFNSIFGSFAGEANTEGQGNSFFGQSAGRSNTTGDNNSFFGLNAGAGNTTGFLNSFFGLQAGFKNTTGASNSFFGVGAGGSNTIGSSNSLFGASAGAVNTQGQNNAYFGTFAGLSATGSFNTFVGSGADFINVSPSGNRNSLLGANAKVLTGGIFSPDNATAIGANAQVAQSNSLVLGSINGINGATASTNVGIGTTAPTARLSIVATGDGARLLHLGTERSWVFKQLGTGAETALELAGNDPTNNNKNFVINTTGFVGIGTTAPTANLSVNGSANKPGGGSWATFSDERLKNIRGRFTRGLNAVMHLQPLRYEYNRDNALALKSEGEHIGFSAQAVQKIIPEAVTKDDRGYLLVNNDPILWTMLNAIKEQQTQIEMLKTANISLTARLRALAKRSRNSIAVRRRTR